MNRRRRKIAFFVSLRTMSLSGAIAIAGCGSGSEFQTAKASGKVVFNGEPINLGLVVFQPIPEGKELPGKAAYGKLDVDGSFILSTYGSDDGAIVGRHKVVVRPPIESDRDDAPIGIRESRNKPWFKKQPEIVLEVKPGETNEFTIDLAQAN
jgi:hypothetical protein